MDELQELRRQIDEIDDKMMVLFEQRMETVCAVGRLKQTSKMPVLQTEREREVLERATGRLQKEEYRDAAEKFMVHLMLLSREAQQKLP